MPSSENYLELSDFTGLLIDNSLTALIKSLENQIQWREQITALDQLSDDEIFANLTSEDVSDWLIELDPDLPALFDHWQKLGGQGKFEVPKDTGLAHGLLEALGELGLDIGLNYTDKAIVVAGERYAVVLEAVKLHLANAAKNRLSVMKEMGLPALVADKVEIKTKMNLISSTRETGPAEPQPAVAPEEQSKGEVKGRNDRFGRVTPAAERAAAGGSSASRFGEAASPNPARKKIAAPVRAKIVGKLTDLEQIREKMPASQSHSINIAAAPTAESSDQQTVNAEITITLRSHFF